jgi:hypothetical protein
MYSQSQSEKLEIIVLTSQRQEELYMVVVVAKDFVGFPSFEFSD